MSGVPENKWVEYKDLEPIRRLQYKGRELLGNLVDITEKRDGENVSIWLDNEDNIQISSHNMITAEDDITNRLKATPEWSKIQDFLETEKHTYGRYLILYGELLKCTSPTRIEPKRKYVHWIMFDVYDMNSKRYLGYNRVYQYSKTYRLPIVRLLNSFYPKSLDELDTKVNEWLKWCKRHRREGIVCKDYTGQNFFKQRIDLPKRQRLSKPNKSDIIYPDMPHERIVRALMHAFDDCGATEEKWNDKRITMPLVAKHMNAEASEHKYKVPNNIYEIYLTTNIQVIAGEILTDYIEKTVEASTLPKEE